MGTVDGWVGKVGGKICGGSGWVKNMGDVGAFLSSGRVKYVSTAGGCR